MKNDNAKWSAMAAFAERFPSDKGWTVLRVDREGMDGLCDELPAYLALAGRAQTLESLIIADTGWESNPKNLRRRLIGDPGIRRGMGFDDEGWYGEVRLRLGADELVVSRRAVRGRYGREEALTLLACRDRTAADRLWTELTAFSRKLAEDGGFMSVCRQGLLPRPAVTWDDVILAPGMREDIRATVESFLAARGTYEEMGLDYRRGLLLAGPPGCGKTMTVKAVVANTAAHIEVVHAGASLYEDALSASFANAATRAPAILVLEDLDRLDTTHISLSFLLNLLDGLSSREGVLVLATANELQKLDPALVHRPSRFDRVWHFGLPGREERRRLLERMARGKLSRRCLDEAVERTDRWTMAYVKEAMVGALLAAVGEVRGVEDEDLLRVIEALGVQRKQTANGVPSLGAAPVGFGSS